jgi:hypothetical protein
MMHMTSRCHGTATAPTAIRNEAMGLAVTASGSNLVPMSVSFGIEDQRDEAPFIRMGKSQGLEANRVKPCDCSGGGLSTAEGGPRCDRHRSAPIEKRDIGRDVYRHLDWRLSNLRMNSAKTDAGLEVLTTLASRNVTPTASRFEGVGMLRGMR